MTKKIILKEYKKIIPITFQYVNPSEQGIVKKVVVGVIKEYSDAATISRKAYDKNKNEFFFEIVVDNGLTKKLILKKLEELIKNI